MLARAGAVLIVLFTAVAGATVPQPAELRHALVVPPDFRIEFFVDPQRGLAVSPDGAFAYLPGGRVHVLARDAVLGTLRLVGFGPAGAGSTVALVTPDGAHLVTIGGNVIAVYARDGATGALAAPSTTNSGIGTVSVLAISPDGAHVYVARDGALAVFARDAGTGALTAVQTLQDGMGGIDGLAGASDVVVSPDGAQVYVVGRLDDAVAVFARDGSSGALSPTQVLDVDIFETPSRLALSPDGAHAYLTLLASTLVYARTPGTGALTLIAAAPIQLGEAIVLSADGAFAYVMRRGPDEAITLAARDAATGQLTPLVTYDADDVPFFDLPTDISLAPDGTNLYFVQRGIGVLRRDPVTGELADLQRKYYGAHQLGLEGAVSLALSPGDANLYAVHPRAESLTTLSIDAVTGVPTVDAVAFDGEVEGLRGAADVVVTGDGRHVYVAGELDDAIAVFARDLGTGAVTQVDVEHGVLGPEQLALAPDDSTLYALRGDTGRLVALARDAASGALTPIDVEEDFAPRAGLDVAVSPDGAHVYVASSSETPLRIYARAADGTLTSVPATQPTDLGTPLELAISADGAHVYVPGSNRLLALARDPATGLLSTIDTQTVGSKVFVGGVGANVALRADETHVYTPGAGRQLHAFLRDPPSGRLRWIGTTELSMTTLRAMRSAASGLTYVAAADGIMTIGPGFAGCDAAPAVCQPLDPAGRSKLMLKRTTPTKQSLKWTWMGSPTVVADFGALPIANPYALCIYDESGPATLVARALANSDFFRWQALNSQQGFKFNDKIGTPEGLRTVVLKATSSGRGTITVKGKGPLLGLPTQPLGLPVRVQLQSRGGVCWEATFSAAGTKRNDAVTYTGNAD